MNIHARKYTEDELPMVGDVVCMGDGAAFDSSIVVKIDRDGTCHLERPHCKLTVIGCCSPTIALMTERYSVPAHWMTGRYVVHVTGARGGIDNRCSQY